MVEKVEKEKKKKKKKKEKKEREEERKRKREKGKRKGPVEDEGGGQETKVYVSNGRFSYSMWDN